MSENDTFIPWISLGDYVKVPGDDTLYRVEDGWGTLFGAPVAGKDADYNALILSDVDGGMVFIDRFPLSDAGPGAIPVLPVFGRDDSVGGCA